MILFIQLPLQTSDFRIKLLQWSALSPDLNRIENLRGILARKIYDQEKPAIENIVKLKKRIKSKREDVQNETIKKLVDSVPNRFVEVIRNKEKSTKSTE